MRSQNVVLGRLKKRNVSSILTIDVLAMRKFEGIKRTQKSRSLLTSFKTAKKVLL